MSKLLKQTIAVTLFYFKKNVAMLILIAVGILIVGYLTSWQAKNGFSNFWNSVFGLLGVLVTFGLTIFYVLKEWQDSLEKRLTVHFKLKDKYLMTCHEAYLSSESDIRAWGQQIGGQMSKVRFLNFFPYISGQDVIVEYNKDLNKFYTKYEVTFYLTEKIEDIVKESPDLKTQYLVWWENDDKTAQNKSIWFDKQPTKPATVQDAIAKEIEIKTLQNAIANKQEYETTIIRKDSNYYYMELEIANIKLSLQKKTNEVEEILEEKSNVKLVFDNTPFNTINTLKFSVVLMS